MATLTYMDMSCIAWSGAVSGQPVKMHTNGLVVTPLLTGTQHFGVLTTSPQNSGDICNVRYQGVASVLVGATVVPGNQLSWNTTMKKAQVATYGHFIIGLALGTATSGNYVDTLLSCYQKNA